MILSYDILMLVTETTYFYNELCVCVLAMYLFSNYSCNYSSNYNTNGMMIVSFKMYRIMQNKKIKSC